MEDLWLGLGLGLLFGIPIICCGFALYLISKGDVARERAKRGDPD